VDSLFILELFISLYKLIIKTYETNLTFLFLLLISIPSFAQLQVLSQEDSKLVFKSSFMSIQRTGDSYDMLLTDTGHTGSMIIHLGDTKEQSLISYNQLGDWFKNAEKKATLSIQGKDAKLTLYKQNESTWLVTEGDGEFARKFFNDQVWSAIGSGSTPTFSIRASGTNPNKADAVSTPKISYLKPAHFKPEKVSKIFDGTESENENDAQTDTNTAADSLNNQ